MIKNKKLRGSKEVRRHRMHANYVTLIDTTMILMSLEQQFVHRSFMKAKRKKKCLARAAVPWRCIYGIYTGMIWYVSTCTSRHLERERGRNRIKIKRQGIHTRRPVQRSNYANDDRSRRDRENVAWASLIALRSRGYRTKRTPSHGLSTSLIFHSSSLMFTSVLKNTPCLIQTRKGELQNRSAIRAETVPEKQTASCPRREQLYQ